MGISRRHFLEIGSIAAAACAVPLEGLAQQRQGEAQMAPGALREGPRQPGRLLNKTLSESSFRAITGQNFTITLANGKKTTATLMAVENLAASAATSRFARTQSFVLRFQLTNGASSLRQGTYEFSQGTIGRFSLFIVPFSATGSNTTFTATVSNPPA